MKKEKGRIKSKRIFSDSFKKSIVTKYEKGESTVNQLEQDYHIGVQLIYRWIHKYSRYYDHGSRIIVEMKSQDQTNKELRAKIKELESIVGKKQITIDYLEKLIELTEKELKISVKKKDVSSPLTGSEQIKKNTSGQ